MALRLLGVACVVAPAWWWCTLARDEGSSDGKEVPYIYRATSVVAYTYGWTRLTCKPLTTGVSTCKCLCQQEVVSSCNLRSRLSGTLAFFQRAIQPIGGRK
jgi:hypothetical protein